MMPRIHLAKGFTLVELAIVLGIVALLLTGLVVSVSAQLDLQKLSETRGTMDNVREALLGFAAANGRLPCPASAASNGQESFASGGSTSNGLCSNFYNGFVPAAALGLTPTDGNGFLLDGWGNRIRYAVDNSTINGVTNPFTRQDGMKAATMASIEATAESSSGGLLFVCSSSSGVTAVNCGSTAGTVTVTRKTPAVVYSTGKNTATGGAPGTNNDEAANPNPNSANNDRVFVHHEPTAAGAGGEFDDIMTWISLPVLFNRMISAGRLP